MAPVLVVWVEAFADVAGGRDVADGATEVCIDGDLVDSVAKVFIDDDIVTLTPPGPWFAKMIVGTDVSVGAKTYPGGPQPFPLFVLIL